MAFWHSPERRAEIKARRAQRQAARKAAKAAASQAAADTRAQQLNDVQQTKALTLPTPQGNRTINTTVVEPNYKAIIEAQQRHIRQLAEMVVELVEDHDELEASIEELEAQVESWADGRDRGQMMLMDGILSIGTAVTTALNAGDKVHSPEALVLASGMRVFKASGSVDEVTGKYIEVGELLATLYAYYDSEVGLESLWKRDTVEAPVPESTGG